MRAVNQTTSYMITLEQATSPSARLAPDLPLRKEQQEDVPEGSQFTRQISGPLNRGSLNL